MSSVAYPSTKSPSPDASVLGLAVLATKARPLLLGSSNMIPFTRTLVRHRHSELISLCSTSYARAGQPQLS